MKRKLFLSALLSIILINSAIARIITPDSYTVTHNDSSWYVTINCYIDDIPDDEQLTLTCCICCKDTCVSDTTRCFQGKKFQKQFNKRNGNTPPLAHIGMQHCQISIPEEMVNDTLVAVTVCRMESNDGSITENDSTYVFLPPVSPLCCHRVNLVRTMADRIADIHRNIFPIKYYESLTFDNLPAYNQSNFAVNFRPGSHMLENGYMENAAIADSLSNIINTLLSDSLSQIEVIQIIGFTAPDNTDSKARDLGLRRAAAFRNKLKFYCNLHDSIFEITDGGRNWELIYDAISSNVDSGDSIIRRLRSEKIPEKRESLLRTLGNGNIYRMLNNGMMNNQRQACCARIYYYNKPDTVAAELNKVVDELANEKNPDYRRLRQKLKTYGNDPRAINLQGVIDYREHRRNAAKKAFGTAAMMGDEQAMTNLLIISQER